MPFTQHERLFQIDTPLGEDVLLLKGFTGQEGISHLFKFDLELLTEGPHIPAQDLIAKTVTIRVNLKGNEERFFVFASRSLRTLHEMWRAGEIALDAHEERTVKAFYLPFANCRRLAILTYPEDFDG